MKPKRPRAFIRMVISSCSESRSIHASTVRMMLVEMVIMALVVRTPLVTLKLAEASLARSYPTLLSPSNPEMIGERGPRMGSEIRLP